ncbi:MAG: nicotinate-nucleotide adenylyltransferase, partial [Leptolyngbya sp. SIO4C1]|nr:nicotinate-nucleotide adenylyltransferase [Leptolyngbya sp. SIO4C1]
MIQASKSRTVALFGTSADPPHSGHRGVLTWLGHHFDQVAVWASDNPFKTHQASLADRMAMLQLLVDSLQTPGVVQLYPALSHRYTVVTIARAQQRWPEAALTLAVGADLVGQLPQWYRAEAIFEQVKILVFPRPGYPVNEADLLKLKQQAKVAIAHPPQQYDVSSTEFRQADSDQGIPPVIQQYIDQHQLYPCPENS